MNSILVLVRKDFALFRRDRVAVLLTFLIPFILIYLFGAIFGVGRKDSGPSGIPLAVVNESSSPAAAELIAALKQEKTFSVVTTTANRSGGTRPLTEEDLTPLIKADRFRFALVLPTDLLSRSGLHAKFLSNPRNEIENQVVVGVLEKTAFTNVPQLLGQAIQERARDAIGTDRQATFNHRLADNIASTYGGNSADIFERLQNGNMGFSSGNSTGPSTTVSSADLNATLGKFVKIDREQIVGQDIKSPQATLLVGGWSMQFLLFAVSASAAALFHEKDRGVFLRILSGPVSRSDILLSKFIYGMLLGLIQLIVLFFAGHFLFGIEIIPYLFPLILVSGCAAAACTAFGMLLASISRSQEAARGLGTLLILLMSALGGAWFPVSFMPLTIQHLAHFTLVYWAMEGFSQVLWAHVPIIQLLPTLGVLLSITVSVMGLAWWRFNRGTIFE